MRAWLGWAWLAAATLMAAQEPAGSSPEGVAGRVDAAGCVLAAQNGCLDLVDARTGFQYELLIANGARPEPGAAITVEAVPTGNLSSCIAGAQVQVVRWAPARISCVSSPVLPHDGGQPAADGTGPSAR